MYDQTKKSSHVHNIRKFMSLKNDDIVRTMSLLEFDFCFHLEYNPDIKSFSSQPQEYYYYFNNRRCRYTPDFLLTDVLGKNRLVEVKYKKKPKLPILYQDSLKEKRQLRMIVVLT